jgi:hypothetical protein
MISLKYYFNMNKKIFDYLYYYANFTYNRAYKIALLNDKQWSIFKNRFFKIGFNFDKSYNIAIGG